MNDFFDQVSLLAHPFQFHWGKPPCPIPHRGQNEITAFINYTNFRCLKQEKTLLRRPNIAPYEHTAQRIKKFFGKNPDCFPAFDSL